MAGGWASRRKWRAKLPAPTQALITLSDFLRSYLIFVLIGMAAAAGPTLK